MRSSGIDIEEAREKKQLIEIITTETENDSQVFIEFVEDKIASALKNSRNAVRVLLTKSKDFFLNSETDLLYTHASLDRICSEKPIILLSQCELKGLSAEGLINIFKTHPIIILEDKIYENPYYINHETLLTKFKHESNKYNTLTSREKIIFKYIVNGYSNKRIAKELSISERTVEAHRANIRRKLDIHKFVDLIKFALKAGIT